MTYAKGYNGYPNDSVRCWCHWTKFTTREEAELWHKPLEEMTQEEQHLFAEAFLPY